MPSLLVRSDPGRRSGPRGSGPALRIRGPVSSFSDYDASPLARILRALSANFGIGTFFGIHVRMYWAAAVITPLLTLSWVAPVAGTWLEALLLTFALTVLLFVVIWTHEMSHIGAGARFGVPTDRITLSPLGGVAHMGAAASPREEFWTALAGPAVHLVWLAVFWPLSLLLPAAVVELPGFRFCPIVFVVWFLYVTNLALLLFNLLPIFPLDGGRVLRSLLARRVHPNRATLWVTTVGMIGGGVLVVISLTSAGLQNGILFAIGISCILGSLQERRMARHALVYQTHTHFRREPWESDPDAWKRGGAAERKEQRPGWFTRWRRRRAARRAERTALRNAEIDREVDEVLDRVHRVGMAALTKREKSVLHRAAQRRRRGAG